MLPNYKIVAIDTTKYWTLEEYPEIKKIWELNYADFNEQTYCCELTPSYCLYPIGFHVEYNDEFLQALFNENGIEDSTERRQCEIEDMVRINTDLTQVSYRHCDSLVEGSAVKIIDVKITEEQWAEFTEYAEGFDADLRQSVEDYVYEIVSQGGVDIIDDKLVIY